MDKNRFLDSNTVTTLQMLHFFQNISKVSRYPARKRFTGDDLFQKSPHLAPT
jgi:hypothetical protein